MPPRAQGVSSPVRNSGLPSERGRTKRKDHHGDENVSLQLSISSKHTLTNLDFQHNVLSGFGTTDSPSKRARMRTPSRQRQPALREESEHVLTQSPRHNIRLSHAPAAIQALGSPCGVGQEERGCIQKEAGLQEDLEAQLFANVISMDPNEEIDDWVNHEPMQNPTSWTHRAPPSIIEAESALKDALALLRPPRNDGQGYLQSALDSWAQIRLNAVIVFLRFYTNQKSPAYDQWMKASDMAALALGKHTARTLRHEAKAFILDRESIPTTPFGYWRDTLIDDEKFHLGLSLYLQQQGTYLRSEDIVTYCGLPEVQERWGLEKAVSLATAKRWMGRLSYRWKQNGHKGQYVDGHERPSVVEYRQGDFLSAIEKLMPRLRKWNQDGTEDLTGRDLHARPVSIWDHDESMFSAHDRRKSRWVKEGESAQPQPKGEGPTLMVSDFVSANHGWLRSKDGKEEARVYFKTGKARDGYFTNDRILEQFQHAMDILKRDYPDEDHVFLVDNATTHLKRADDALSAWKMPMRTPPMGKNWGIQVNQKDADGNIVYAPNGNPLKTTIPVASGTFRNGSPHEFYFPEDHPRAGVFKGMAVILKERGYTGIDGLPAECPGFKCKDENVQCCCRRILFNEPDFRGVKSRLEILCESQGFQVIFLPKFHCKLNAIEQCWCRAKLEYRTFPPSSREEDLRRNVQKALDSVELVRIRR